ncbi:molybdopterin-dependent oxidoreductase [Variovorax sp. LjRoot178]|uniref:molybdopterin-dependent oxidoreductase n=1 Tax=Variovorax sp. LjRoot178 TaxID=3342277 RepID=UPI003ECE6A66
MLFGHNPKRHSWTPIYNAIRRAKERGAKLIVMDPRKSESAERADLWLPLKPGTDAAMCFGWLKVILDEELYDKAFVEKWTTGFAEFRKRVDEFPLERVTAITGVAPELIAQAARMYATTGPAVIPWTPITDQQRNSTSAIRLMCSLRALCGYVDVPGGELLHGFHPDIIHESELELHDALLEAQRAKQLGADKHPAFTYRGTAALGEQATARFQGALHPRREVAHLSAIASIDLHRLPRHVVGRWTPTGDSSSGCWTGQVGRCARA